MVHPEGFEPPTKWFEATYSIQLSYGCIWLFALWVVNNIREGSYLTSMLLVRSIANRRYLFLCAYLIILVICQYAPLTCNLPLQAPLTMP